jgi:glucosyl-3-phosphoglycerate synthase
VLSWFARRTSRAADWPEPLLAATKGERTVSVVIPARNEEATVGDVVACVAGLAARTGLVDEIVVMDSGSTDRTAAVAAAAGATVYAVAEVLPAEGDRPGKGEALWKSLAVATGELIVFLDGDLVEFGPHFVTGLLGPLLTDPDVRLVKGCYDRPHGGRVTELVARPLLNHHLPDLACVVQPLAGEYAARRDLLVRLPFAGGYGVEIGLLVDTYRAAGLDAIAQVDLGRRDHRHSDERALGRMAAEVHLALLSRVEGRPQQPAGLTQFARDAAGDWRPVPVTVDVTDRPPISTICANSVTVTQGLPIG